MIALFISRRTLLFAALIGTIVGAQFAVTPALSQQRLNTGSRLEAMLRDAETAAGFAASGKLLYDADSHKETWQQYCKNSNGLADRGEFRQAVREASKVLFLGQISNNTTALTWASRDLAYAYSLAGDLDRAEEWANQALTYLARSQLGRDRGSVLATIQKITGDVAMRRDQIDLAIKHYRNALSQLFGVDPQRLPIRLSIVNAEIRRGKIDVARQILDDVGAGETRWVPFISRASGQLAFAERNYLKAADYFAAAANGMRGTKDTYHLMWMQHGLGQALAAGGDREKALTAFREAIASAQQLRTQFRSSEFRAGFFGDVQTIYDDAIGLLVDAKRFDEALALSEESRARTLLDTLKGLAKDEPLDTTQAVARMPPKAITAVYHVLNNRTVVWMVRTGTTDAAVIPVGRKELSVQVESFRRAIVNRSPDTLGQSRKLYDLLIQPLGLKPDEVLVVVPHKSLHYLPMQALSGPQGYLIEERAVASVPSLNAMLAIVDSGAQIKPAMLAMGNPDLGNPAFALPGAEQEVKNIGALYPEAQVFVRLEANKPRFLSQAPGNGRRIQV